jgi:hypothetical protein
MFGQKTGPNMKCAVPWPHTYMAIAWPFDQWRGYAISNNRGQIKMKTISSQDAYSSCSLSCVSTTHTRGRGSYLFKTNSVTIFRIQSQCLWYNQSEFSSRPKEYIFDHVTKVLSDGLLKSAFMTFDIMESMFFPIDKRSFSECVF